MSKFLSSGSGGGVQQLQDGTSYINVSTAFINNLAPNQPVKSGADRSLTSSLLSPSDLDFAVLSNPFAGTLQASGDIEANYDTTPIGLVATNTLAAAALPKSGGTLTGNLAAGTNSISCGSFSCAALTSSSLSSTGDIIADSDSAAVGLLATRTIADAALPKAGGVLTGTVSMGSNAFACGPITSTGTVSASDLQATALTTAGYVKNSATGLLSTQVGIPQADVTNLTADLDLKAPKADPLFTGSLNCDILVASGNVFATSALAAFNDITVQLNTTPFSVTTTNTNANTALSRTQNISAAGTTTTVSGSLTTGSLSAGTNAISGGAISGSSLSSSGALSVGGNVASSLVCNNGQQISAEDVACTRLNPRVFGGPITCNSQLQMGAYGIICGPIICSQLRATNLTVQGYVICQPNGDLWRVESIPQADVANLVADLALKSPLMNPTFTGVVTCPQLRTANIQIDQTANTISCTNDLSIELPTNKSLTLRTNSFGSPAGTINIEAARNLNMTTRDLGEVYIATQNQRIDIVAGTADINTSSLVASSLRATNLLTAGYTKNSATGALSTAASIPQADVDNLVGDLALKAPIANPVFTGSVTCPLVATQNIQIDVPQDYISSTNQLFLAPALDKNLTLLTQGTGNISLNASRGVVISAADNTIQLIAGDFPIVMNAGGSFVNCQSTLVAGVPRAVVNATPGTALTLTAGLIPRTMPMPCTGSNLSQFTLDTATGLLTYTGTRTATFVCNITWAATFNTNGGNATYITYGPTLTQTKAICVMNGLNAAATIGSSAAIPITLATNDTVQLRMQISQTTETLTFTNMQMTLTSVLA
jgi:hypothetical protein